MSVRKVALIYGRQTKGIGFETARHNRQQGVKGLMGERNGARARRRPDRLKDEG